MSTNKIKADRENKSLAYLSPEWQNKSPAITVTKKRNSNPTKICYQRSNTQEETITFIKPNQTKSNIKHIFLQTNDFQALISHKYLPLKNYYI